MMSDKRILPFTCATDRETYDRQPGEPLKSWIAFVVYRDMGYDRTLRKSADFERKRDGSLAKLDTVARKYEKWSVRWNWAERVADWDRALDKQRRRKMLEGVSRMRDRHMNLAKSMQALGAGALTRWLTRLKKASEEGTPIAPKDVRKLIETGMKLERMSRGEPETVIEERHQITAADQREALAPLLEDDEAMDAVNLLLGKMNPNEGSSVS